VQATFPDAVPLLLQLTYPALRDLAEEAHPIEAVALVTSSGHIWPLINQRRSEGSYMVSQRQMEEAFDNARGRHQSPVAFFHSHPTRTADPSPHDEAQMAEVSGSLFFIYGIDGLAAWIWDDETDRPKKEGFVTHGELADTS
jgi:proteasome lid subunit RPN8/RPN11